MIYHKQGIQYELRSYKDDPELKKIINRYLQFIAEEGLADENLTLHSCLPNAIYAMAADHRISYAEGFLGTEISRYKLHAWNIWKEDYAFDLTSEVLLGDMMPITVTEWSRGKGYEHVCRATNHGTRLAYKAHLHRIKSPLEKKFSLFDGDEMQEIYIRILTGGKCIVEEA